MVFTNPIITTHVNKIVDQPLMSSMAVGRCKNANVMHSKVGYRKPITITTQILDHRDGHCVKPNKVALKYLDFKKDVDLDVHVKVFNFAIKANAESSEEYIINAFNYTLRDMASKWCHNYMSNFFTMFFRNLHICRKTQNDKQIYMELKNMKQKEIKVEVYYE
jgi:hypothetical protein